jgi:hypothetical protein
VKRILLAIVILCPVIIPAQDIKPLDIKTGLWETTVTSQITGLPAMPAIPEDQLAKMPPETRAHVEAMMKGRGAAGSPQTRTQKNCITSESLNKPLFDNGDQSCTRKLTGSSAGSQQIHFECARSNMKTTGDLNLERVDSEHVKGTMAMKSGGANETAGRNMDMKMTFSAKWLAADCGDVKPVEK